MKRTLSARVDAAWPCGLPDELWRVEILAPHLGADSWARTRVMLRRTCRWFAANVRVAPVAALHDALVRETEQLAACRAWWPALAHGLHVPEALGEPWPSAPHMHAHMDMEAALGRVLARGAVPAFWLAYGSMPRWLAAPGMADSGLWPFSWWHQCCAAGNVRALQALWDHTPPAARHSASLLNDLLCASLEQQHAGIFAWLTNLPIAYWRVQGEQSPDDDGLVVETHTRTLWSVFLVQRYALPLRREPHDPVWARGYVRCVINLTDPRSLVPRESKAWWARVRQWAQ